MKRSQFISNYKISKDVPINIDSKIFSVQDFTREAKSFLYDNFEGLFNIETDIEILQHVKLPLNYLIYFFKLLAIDVHAKALINVKFSCDYENFFIQISAEGGLPIEENELRQLIRAARDAGFNTNKTEDGLFLKRAVIEVTSTAVFTRIAVPKPSIAMIFSRIFFGKK